MSWKLWLHSLGAAFIGGASSTVTVMIVDPIAFNLSDIPKLLKVAAVSGLFSVAMLLKKSPLPDAPEIQNK